MRYPHSYCHSLPGFGGHLSDWSQLLRQRGLDAGVGAGAVLAGDCGGAAAGNAPGPKRVPQDATSRSKLSCSTACSVTISCCQQ